MSYNVPAYAMFGGGKIGSEATHHRQVWVERRLKGGAKPHTRC